MFLRRPPCVVCLGPSLTLGATVGRPWGRHSTRFLVRLQQRQEADPKCDEVAGLGSAGVIAVDNDDALMRCAASLRFVVAGREGVTTWANMAADLAGLDITDALEALLSPTRLSSTLRD